MKRIFSLAAALLLAFGLSGAASAAPLVVAHDTNFKPFEFKHENGNYTGFDIELWDALAKRAHEEGRKVLLEPHQTGDGYYEACILDPDGNRVEITKLPE